MSATWSRLFTCSMFAAITAVWGCGSGAENADANGEPTAATPGPGDPADAPPEGGPQTLEPQARCCERMCSGPPRRCTFTCFPC
jgi:hypothetical protein